MKIYETWFQCYGYQDTRTKYFFSKSAANKWQREKYAEYKNEEGEYADLFNVMTDYIVHEVEFTKKGILDFLNRNAEF